MAYVAVSRSAHDAQLFTNDRQGLSHALGHDVSHRSAHAPEIQPEAVAPKQEIAHGIVLDRLPCDTAAMIRVQLTALDQLEVQIEGIEERIAAVLKPSPEVRLLRTVPGIGEILAPLVWLEIGDVDRFPRAENLASYAGLVPRVIASGGRIRHGGTCRNVNQHLKWGFVEAATCSLRIKAYRGSISNGSINGSLPERAMAGPWSPSRGTWRKPVPGCCASNSPTSLQRRAPSRPTRPEPSSSRFG